MAHKDTCRQNHSYTYNKSKTIKFTDEESLGPGKCVHAVIICELRLCNFILKFSYFKIKMCEKKKKAIHVPVEGYKTSTFSRTFFPSFKKKHGLGVVVSAHNPRI